KSATGSDLLQEVCQYLGLRELEFFGLYFFKHPSPVVAGVSASLSSFSRRMPWQTGAAEQCAIHHCGVPFWLKMDRKMVEQCKRRSSKLALSESTGSCTMVEFGSHQVDFISSNGRAEKLGAI
ncbi:hypothetical protein TSMEX_011241, partial [Taenia solium]